MNKKRYFYGVFSTVFGQIISVLCGIVLPRVLIGQYGSELYGATTSITQFLSYIALLEGGIGGVARAALYKPLVEGDNLSISKVISYVERFFRTVALIFCIYALFIAFSYKFIAKDSSLDWTFTFVLVIVIALSSLAQYYFGITYTVLLQADQRMFVTSLLGTGATLFNTIISCILAFNGANMIVLKLSWCCVHLVRIFVLNLYVKKKYNLKKVEVKEDFLPQKWDGLGQHIAYFLHSHTDVAILTIFVNLTEVAVYSVYHYIAVSLNQIVRIVATNVEPIFGNLLAKSDQKALVTYFDRIEFLLNSMAMICYSVAISLIVPFVDLYTSGIDDANYHRQALSALILVAEMIICIRIPYHQITIAAGRFKETRSAAYVEAILNIGLSVILAIRYGVEGIVLATAISVLYRFLFYVFYLKSSIIKRPISKFLKRVVVTIVGVCTNVMIYNSILRNVGNIENYFVWIIIAIMFVLIGSFTTVLFSLAFYRDKVFWVFGKLIRGERKSAN